MSFDQKTFSPVSSQASDTPALYLYRTSDTNDSITAPGYFDDKINQLEVGDIIFVSASDGTYSIRIISISTTVSTQFFSPVMDEDGYLGIGTVDPDCNLHILDESGLVCLKIESTDADNGILQTQHINDSNKELSIGKLGSNVDFFGQESGAVLNRSGNLNIINDGNDPIIFYTDTTDSQNLTSTEKARIEPGGTLVFKNGGETWKDINIGAPSLGGPPGLQPDTVQFVDNTGANTGIYTFGVAIGEAFGGSFEMQHDYKEGSDIYFHIHFQGATAPTGTDNINFQLEYTLSRNGGTLAPVNTITKEIGYDTQYSFSTITFDVIDGADVKIGDQFLFTLKRISASANEYTGDAVIATVGIHYQQDTLGSRQMTAK